MDRNILYRSYSLHDKRWLDGVQELKSANFIQWQDEESIPTYSYRDKSFKFYAQSLFVKYLFSVGASHLCTTCNCFLSGQRSKLLEHYHSSWHRHNARRLVSGKSVLAEDEFLKGRDIEELSTISDYASSNDDSFFPQFGSRYMYFVQNGVVYSMYRCILLHNEDLSLSVFCRPLDCAIILLAGGHFAAGIFTNGELVVHRAFHRYTVRAKQGRLQSINDKTKSASHSAGATLRRYNELSLRQDISKLLHSWSSYICQTPLLFIRCSRYQQSAFFLHSGINRRDNRIRSIPFETKRPLMNEIMRTFKRLTTIGEHGAVEDFIANAKQKRDQSKTRDVLLKNKREDTNAWSVVDSDKETDIRDLEVNNFNQNMGLTVQRKESLWPELDKKFCKELYSVMRENNEKGLGEILDCRTDLNEVLNYLSMYQMAPEDDTFLHMSAKRGLNNVLKVLLNIGCDPSITNSAGRVPYSVCVNRSVKQIFLRFRDENPDRWNWAKCHIPEPVNKSDGQSVELIEKKRKRKKRFKDQMEAEDLTTCLSFLELSEHEKPKYTTEARLSNF